MCIRDRSWPVVTWSGRALRGLAVLALLVMGVLQLTGKLTGKL